MLELLKAQLQSPLLIYSQLFPWEILIHINALITIHTQMTNKYATSPDFSFLDLFGTTFMYLLLDVSKSPEIHHV